MVYFSTLDRLIPHFVEYGLIQFLDDLELVVYGLVFFQFLLDWDLSMHFRNRSLVDFVAAKIMGCSKLCIEFLG